MLFKNDFQHLLLLVGTNPLPNYVVGRFFLDSSKNLKTIWLIHSEEIGKQKGTKLLADNLKICFKNLREGLQVNMVSLQDVGSAILIREDLQEKLYKELCGGGKSGEFRVHLDYTGGTKVMSVHVHSYIKEKFPGASFSYLDVRNYSIREDKYGKINDKDLRKLINIDLTTLLDIHNYKKVDSGNNNYPKNQISFFSAIVKKDLVKNYTGWLKESSERKKNKIEEKPVWPEQFSAIEKELDVTIDGQKLLKMDGKILDEYVYEILKKHLDAEKMTEQNKIYWDVEITRGKQFQLDVIIINGYQVCIISCTFFDREGSCKEKGFEVLHRANQIGGDESKAVLLTCLPRDKVGIVCEDLKTVSGSADDKLLVLGIDDLKEEVLWVKIKKHVWGEK
ncbi:MAG: hypothetical protein DDT32_00643 [Syntrophomonadaceae bacterium]|nr:hypothetical protein [Bacillota bacterium]